MSLKRFRAGTTMYKQASKIEQHLIASFLRRGRPVPISTASRATGLTYPSRFKTLNDFVQARNRLFAEKFVPAKRRLAELYARGVPLETVTTGMSEPVYRGVTKLPRNHMYINGQFLPDSVMSRLPDDRRPTFLDKLERRRFFTDEPLNAFLYANAGHGTGEMRIVDMGTPYGRLARRAGIVVGTPHLDSPSSKYRRAVRRMIDSGEIVPDRDLAYPSSIEPNARSMNDEMTIPFWLRPFLNERKVTIVNSREVSSGLPGWQSGDKPTIRVLQGSPGAEYARTKRNLYDFLNRYDDDYIFSSFDALRKVMAR